MEIQISIQRLKLFAFALVGAILALVGLLVESSLLSLAGLVSSAGAALGSWAIYQPRAVKCRGSVDWYESDSRQVQIGICRDCRRWYLVIRDSQVAQGSNLETFVEAAERAAKSYDAAVPEISMELRSLVSQLEAKQQA